jgi:hypothetical protein
MKRLYTKVQVTLTINETIDYQTLQDSHLLEDWIYSNVTEHNSEWDNVEIIEQELSEE